MAGSEDGKFKQYIGDGLYADFDGWHIVLETPQGMVVYLDPEVVASFETYLKALKERLQGVENVAP